MRRLRFESATKTLIEETKTGPYGNIVPLIKQGKVVPIISNSFFIEHIFAEDEDLKNQPSESSQFDDEDFTVEEQLTKEWADFINYPMPDKHNITRVAQYHLVEQAKEKVTSSFASLFQWFGDKPPKILTAFNYLYFCYDRQSLPPYRE